VTFRRAGHILGSASVALELPEGGRLVFSGDVGRYGAPVLPDPTPPGEADWIVVESTYGDREHDPVPIADQLERVVLAAVKRGGALLVPAFAVGRTQELMYHLSLLERSGRVPVLPAYVDSPMAVNATEIYCAHPEDFEGDVRDMVMGSNCPLHCADFHLARSAAQSKAINRIEGPVIVVAASGMLAGGRILHHLRRRLPDPRTTLLFAGYQAAGTRGRRIQDGARSVSIFGEDVPVRSAVEAIHGLSAHADRTGLLRWLTGVPRPPRRVFVVHGEPGPAQALASLVRAQLDWKVEVPELGGSFALEAES
jgi:metallo-beta-lactamase family protein